MRIKKLIRTIFGDEKDAPLEYRLFLSTIIVGAIVSLLGTITSIILSSEFSVIILALSLFILLSVLYYFVRIRKIYRPLVGPIIVLALVGISLIWILDGGINGSNMLIGFVVLVLSLIIVPDKNKKYVISLFIVLIFAMYHVQLFRPELIKPFASERARWIDSLVTTLYSSIFLFFIIKFLHTSYNTERKRARDNELNFRALSENSQDSISRYDRKHRHAYINKAGLELRGQSLEQVMGKTHSEAGFLDEEQSVQFEEIIEKAFLTKEPQHGQFSIDRPAGTIYYDWRIYPEINSENKVVSVLGVARDITELKHSENELLQLNHDKDRFISILGHDLKGPLYTLLGITELFEENIQNYTTAEIASIMAEMNQSTRITYNLLEDILKWTKAQSGKIPYQPQKLEFSDICESIIVTLGPNASAKSIQLECKATDSLTVTADGDMLRTILRNLLSNAIKFTKKGGEIKILAEVDSTDTTISVSDNGIGIAPDDMKKLFNIAEVHSTKGTANEKGTGLGLLLCKEFVETHGGKIWAESELGNGTTIKFTLPVNQLLKS